MFTSVAIAQLIEQGRLSLDDTVGELLAAHPWTAQARGITLRQLLSHTSGMGGLFDRPATCRDRSSGTRPRGWRSSPPSRCTSARESARTTATRDSRRWPPSWSARRGSASTTTCCGTCCARRDGYRPPRRAGGFAHGPRHPFAARGRRPVRRPAADHPQPRMGRGRRRRRPRGAEDMFRCARALLAGRLVGRAMLDTLIAGGRYRRRRHAVRLRLQDAPGERPRSVRPQRRRAAGRGHVQRHGRVRRRHLHRGGDEQLRRALLRDVKEAITQMLAVN